MNAETAALAQVNGIGVELENLFLGELLLEMQRQQDLGNLPAPRTVAGVEEQRTRKLHGEGGCALLMPPLLHVHPCGTKDPERVDPGVVEETLILGGEHRVHHDFRNLVEVDNAAFLALLVEQVRDQLRFQHVLVDLGVVL